VVIWNLALVFILILCALRVCFCGCWDQIQDTTITKKHKEHEAKAFCERWKSKHYFCSTVAINEDKNETKHSMRIITHILVLLFFLNNVSGQNGGSNLKITRLTGEFYVFTTFNSYKGKLVPANGMYLVTDNGVVNV
jgi:hypothetical protein